MKRFHQIRAKGVGRLISGFVLAAALLALVVVAAPSITTGSGQADSAELAKKRKKKAGPSCRNTRGKKHALRCVQQTKLPDEVTPEEKAADTCPPPAPGGPQSLTSHGSFTASLDAQFPIDPQGRLFAGPGAAVEFGFNIRFNQVFSPSFVLAPDTPGTAGFLSDTFGEDLTGQVAPNDDHVGYYRAIVTVPSCTPSGGYLVRWNVINRTNGFWGGLQPSFVVVVS